MWQNARSQPYFEHQHIHLSTIAGLHCDTISIDLNTKNKTRCINKTGFSPIRAWGSLGVLYTPSERVSRGNLRAGLNLRVERGPDCCQSLRSTWWFAFPRSTRRGIANKQVQMIIDMHGHNYSLCTINSDSTYSDTWPLSFILIIPFHHS